MNSEEIAKLANVSRSTVSRVVNHYKNVPPETREKVMRVIEKYGYTPNVSARTLAGKTNNIIGLFVADIVPKEKDGRWVGASSPYHTAMISHVIASCKKRGYLTLVYTISDLEECEQIKQYFDNRTLFGGIFLGFPYQAKQPIRLAEEGYNVVLIDQLLQEDDEEKKFKLVNTDNLMGGYLATNYLLQCGHTKIAHVTGDDRLSSILRKKGYEKALQEAKITIEDPLVVCGKYRKLTAYEETKKLLEKEKPTAFFVANDIMAIGVVQAIRECGLRMPEDVSVIGFDNIEAARWSDMNLTTMETSLEQLAEISVAELFNQETGLYESVCPTLLERESVSKI